VDRGAALRWWRCKDGQHQHALHLSTCVGCVHPLVAPQQLLKVRCARGLQWHLQQHLQQHKDMAQQLGERMEAA